MKRVLVALGVGLLIGIRIGAWIRPAPETAPGAAGAPEQVTSARVRASPPAQRRAGAETRFGDEAASPMPGEATVWMGGEATVWTGGEVATRGRSETTTPARSDVVTPPPDTPVDARRAVRAPERRVGQLLSDVPYRVLGASDDGRDDSALANDGGLWLQVEPGISDAGLEALVRDAREFHSDADQLIVRVVEAGGPRDGHLLAYSRSGLQGDDFFIIRDRRIEP